MKSSIAAADVARAITAHGLGVRVEGADPRPATWTRWHEAEKTALSDRIEGAYNCIANLHVQLSDLGLKLDRWRLAAVVGWALLAMLVAAGWGR